MKERLFLCWVYTRQHADFMFGLGMGLEDLWLCLTGRQKFVRTDDYLGNLLMPFINLGTLFCYLLTWGFLFVCGLLLFPSLNRKIFTEFSTGEDEVMIDFLQDAITANHQGVLDRVCMAVLLLVFVVVSFAVALILFLMEALLALIGQEMYMNDEH